MTFVSRIGYAYTYSYDSVGNRTRLLKSGSPTTYLYDASNQLNRSQDSTGYTTSSYDGCGDLTVAGARQTAHHQHLGR